MAKKSKSTPKYNSQRETRVLLEQIRSEVKTIAEGQSIIVSKLDEMDNKLRKLDSASFKTEMELQAIKSKTGTIDIKVDRIEKELGSVKNVVIDVNATIKDQERRIQKLEGVSI